MKIVNLQDAKKNDVKQRNLENYGNKIKKFRVQAGLTADELAEKLQVAVGSIRNWECGIARPDPDCLYQMFTILDVEPNEFFGLKGIGSLMTIRERTLLSNYRHLDAAGKEDLETYADAMVTKAQRRILVSADKRMSRVASRSLTVAAGNGDEWPDNPEAIEILLYHDAIVDRADEIFIVNGESMEPQFRSEDKVLVEYCTDLKVGDIGIFYVPGVGGVIKQKMHDRLHSLNPKYDDIFPYEDGARVVGRVLGIIDESMIPDKDDQVLYTEAQREKAEHPTWFE